MEETKTTKKKMSKALLFGWPTRTISYSIATVLLGYVTFFATDIMGIPALTAGMVFMVSKIFDGVTDFIAGYLIDKTNSKWGKGRPYELALIGYWGSTVALFAAPEFGVSGSVVYLFVMYTLINSVFYTMLCCAEPVYMANAIEDSSQGILLQSIGSMISLIFIMGASIIMPQYIANFTTRAEWFRLSVILAVPFTLIGLIRFAVVKEVRVSDAKASQNFNLKTMFETLKQNKYILLFSCIILISNIGSNLYAGVTNYYAQYILGDLSVASVLTLAMIPYIFTTMLMPVLSKKFGFYKVIRVTTILGTAGYFLRLLAPGNVMAVLITSAVAYFGFYTMFAFVATFVIDCMDYGEWKTGIRAEGTISCVQSIFAKVGTAAGAGVIGILMGLSGYNGKLDVQPETANQMIIALYSIVPGILCAVQFILLKFFDMDKIKPRMDTDLKMRRGEK